MIATGLDKNTEWWDIIDDMNSNRQCVYTLETIIGGGSPLGGWISSVCRESCEECCRANVGY